MSKLLEMLSKKKMTLIVQLPENNIEMAKAAEAAGADALIINNGEIIKGIKIPIGIDLSSQGKLDEKELKKYEKFDFINFHFDSLTAISKRIKTGKIIALSNSYTLDKVIGVENIGAQAIDAAIVPLSQASRDLVVGDLQNYIAIAISSGLPVIIPTQRTIKPSEVAIIADTGAKGLLLTKVVLGDSVKSIEKAVKEYRLSVDDLG
jgi:putative N-acetylmannosamine-6-phosphate epimerase